MDFINVIINGACGKMGQEAVKAVYHEEDMEVAGAVDIINTCDDIGNVTGIGPINVEISNNLDTAIKDNPPHVIVDFTTPDAVMTNLKKAINAGINCVVGTTGFSEEDLNILDELAKEYDVGVIIAPNFAIGAILMMKFAGMACKYMPEVEIIELHHDKKLDSPSGTAVKTAELISKQIDLIEGKKEKNVVENISGARGGNYKGINIHSIRLPGLVAHQEVIFGGTGQTLKIRHDSLNRQSFMPGVIMAIRKVVDVKGLIYGLDNLIEL